MVMSGLTGVGKTTQSRYLAECLSFGLISGSAVRNAVMGMGVDSAGHAYSLFSEQSLELDRARMADPHREDPVEDHIASLYATSVSTVFDTWFLPWLIETPSLCVWLDAPLEVRAANLHTELAGFGHPPHVILEAVKNKDERARAFGMLRHGVDIFVDRSPFDVVIDVPTGLINPVRRILASIVATSLGLQHEAFPPELTQLAEKIVKLCPQRARSLFMR